MGDQFAVKKPAITFIKLGLTRWLYCVECPQYSIRNDFELILTVEMEN